MSVIGVGVDLVEVSGFVEQLQQPGSTFGAAAFTAGERADVQRGADSSPPGADARRLATRYAAKEAFIKAWSASRFGLPPTLPEWRPHEIEVVCDVEGRPRLRVSGAVGAAVDAQLGSSWIAHVSLSHDGPMAGAVVVLEAPDAPTQGSAGPR